MKTFNSANAKIAEKVNPDSIDDNAPDGMPDNVTETPGLEVDVKKTKNKGNRKFRKTRYEYDMQPGLNTGLVVKFA